MPFQPGLKGVADRINGAKKIHNSKEKRALFPFWGSWSGNRLSGFIKKVYGKKIMANIH